MEEELLDETGQDRAREDKTRLPAGWNRIIISEFVFIFSCIKKKDDIERRSWKV